MQLLNNPLSVSIYSREAIRAELARQREILRVRGLIGRVVIGCAYTPTTTSAPADQAWLKVVILGQQ